MAARRALTGAATLLLCAAAEVPAASAEILVYEARTGAWVEAVGSDLEVGDAYLDDGRLLRVDADVVVDRGPARLDDLAGADGSWVAQAGRRVPGGEEWVLVLGDGDASGHWRLADVVPGALVAFQGEVFETRDLGDGLEVRATGDVVAEATDTFVRPAPEVIDATIAHGDGSTTTLTGTPNHPFWVPGERRYVPLGELEVGTRLHVQRGGEAILVGKVWRQGDFEVFDFEVAGLHNFYVGGPKSDAAGGLVHNSTASRGGSATFHRYDGPGLGPTGRHVTVEIKDAGGKSLGEFHQTGAGKRTSIEPVLSTRDAEIP